MLVDLSDKPHSGLPPLPVCIAGAAILALGTASLVLLVLTLIFAGTSRFDVGFLAIPLGYGILAGKSKYRRIALFFLGAWFVIWTLSLGGRILGVVEAVPDAPPFSLSSIILIAIGLGGLFWCLKWGPGINEWFKGEVEGRTSIKNLAWSTVAAIAVTGIFIFPGSCYRQRHNASCSR